MSIRPTPGKVNDIAAKVWRTVLGFRLAPVPCDPARAEAEDFVVSTVTISGAWQGILTHGCSTGLARRAAAAMFGKSPEETEPDEIRDALGELTNMVGGNFKTTLQGDCRLSLPSIADAVPYRQVEPVPTCQQWFECEGGVVLLHVARSGADGSGP
jgi:chemotaxis protein CheX